MQQPMVIQTAPISNKVTIYNSTASYILGGLQIAIGVICIILNVVGITALGYALFFVGHGIWAGLFFIITGAFGLGAGCSKKKCLIITFMVLSILSAALFVLAMGAYSAIAVDSMKYYGYGYGYRYYYGGRLSLGLNGTMLAFAVLELIVAVLSAVNCCRAVCCGASQQPAGQVFFMQTASGIQGQASGQAQFILQQINPQQPVGQSVAPPPYISQQGGVQSGGVIQPANVPQHGVVFQPGQITRQQIDSNQIPATTEEVKQPV